MQYRPLQTGALTVSPGILLGTHGTAQLLERVNASLGNTRAFESALGEFAGLHQKFHEDIIVPIRQAAAAVGNAIQAILQPDAIRPLTELEDFAHVPPSMYEGILLFEPVMNLLKQGRIAGFGYDYNNLVGCEDVYGRLINNGKVDNALLARNPDTCRVTLSWEWRCTDPRLDWQQIEAFERTRERIVELIDETDIDFTDYPNLRG